MAPSFESVTEFALIYIMKLFSGHLGKNYKREAPDLENFFAMHFAMMTINGYAGPGG